MLDLKLILKKYEKCKIAIYGLGTETEKVLRELSSQFQIIGLLDGYRSSGILYDMPIISLEQAVEEQIKLIIVAARPGSCKAIAKRIGKVCIDNHIVLIDIRGKNLCDINKVVYDFKNFKGITKQQLLEKVAKKDIVSFDLFDTLIMRQTLFSTDILELLDYELKKRKVIIEDFKEKRLACEKELSKHTAPTLVEIYAFMKEIYAVTDLIPENVAELEWQIDYELIVPREEVCALLADISRSGKKIYIVSDSYYTKSQLVKMLDKCMITEYIDILDSCEFKTSKTQDLFENIKEIAGKQSYIHIGDDQIADIESAVKNGICACQLYSGIELLEMSGYMGLWDEISSLSDRIRIGMFVSKIFNSPFQFENDERKISVYSAYDIGYLFFAPMISDFTIWFYEKVRNNNLKNIFFCSRDGYLIKKLYDELVGNTSSIYFLTSRTASIRAGVESIDDIKYVQEMKFSGSLQEQLRERFGIYENSKANFQLENGNLLDCSEMILDRGKPCRERYKKYIDKLDIREGNIAFFDFVAKGTSQFFCGRLLKNHLEGFYFLQLEKENMKERELDIQSFYKSDERDNSAIFENYYILESILTAPTPSIKEFDDLGAPLYAEETRTSKDIKCLCDVQNGIHDYFKTYLNICPENLLEVNKKLDEIMLSLIHGLTILNEDFLNLKVEDPFFNRITNLTDLI